MNRDINMVTAGIIDDDKIFTYGFKKLSSIKGIFNEILEFNNGKEAIDYLTNPDNNQRLPDVLFVDINMPVMNGWEFNEAFGEIKSQLGKDIVVYTISSSIDPKDINRAKNNPLIADYIVKPIDLTYLASIYENLQTAERRPA
ncbi:two-component system response regulator [Mucilaginibacter litoreus]|uniref:Two-component system response regulator n=1 Tax=Mucilaginibacter litoreus TaxID=1048221 RepID=A0ABW3AUV2_9SPHI